MPIVFGSQEANEIAKLDRRNRLIVEDWKRVLGDEYDEWEEEEDEEDDVIEILWNADGTTSIKAHGDAVIPRWLINSLLKEETNE